MFYGGLAFLVFVVKNRVRDINPDKIPEECIDILQENAGRYVDPINFDWTSDLSPLQKSNTNNSNNYNIKLDSVKIQKKESQVSKKISSEKSKGSSQKSKGNSQILPLPKDTTMRKSELQPLGTAEQDEL